jgi:hypothetical protein
MTGSESRVRPEMELLLCCARTRLDAACSARLRRLVVEELDWPYLLEAAEEHGVKPLLYWQLKSHCRPEVPQLWMERLEEAFRQNARRNLCLIAELIRIVELFRRHAIQAIPHKGPILAEQVYGSLALRQFVDLDIVVRQRDVPKVHELMTSQGFQAEVSGERAHGIPGQYVFTRESGRIVVEIHSERTLRYFPTPLDLDAMSERLETIPLDGGQVQTFSAEQALPILCVHGSKHFWERLAWVCDIAEMAQAPRGMDWDAALGNARRLGAERMVSLGLYLARDLLGAALPQEVWRRVQSDRVAQLLAAQVRALSFSGARSELGVVQRFSFRVRMRGNTWEGLRYALRLAAAPTEEDWSQLHFRKPLPALYTVLRPFRLLRKYGLRKKTSRPQA